MAARGVDLTGPFDRFVDSRSYFPAQNSNCAWPRRRSTPVANVLVNDTLGGAPATLANVVLTQLSVTPVTTQVRLNVLQELWR